MSHKVKNRMGNTSPMKCGMSATVIAYRNADDIDVQFEDGAIAFHKTYYQFFHGIIAHPSQAVQSGRYFHEQQAKERIGMTLRMKNGLRATIVDYQSARKIHVCFEDGEMCYSTWQRFKDRDVTHPTKHFNSNTSLQEYALRYYLERLGFRKVEQGEWIDSPLGKQELDFYLDLHKVAIEYDGDMHQMERIHERDLFKNKHCKEMGITLYRIRSNRCETLNSDSIDFVLNKEKKIHADYYDCKTILETILRNHNISFEPNFIDFYRDEDDIRNRYRELYFNYHALKKEGEQVWCPSMRQMLTLTKYYTANNVTVQAENGTIFTNISYNTFKKGMERRVNSIVKVGLEKIMNCGLKAKIIRYRHADDIDVEFEDGRIREHVRYANFRSGYIRPHSLDIAA